MSYFWLDVWGFDENAVKVLETMKPVDESLIYKYAILLGGKTLKPVTNDNEVYFRYCYKSLGLGTFQEYIYKIALLLGCV